MAFLLRAKHWQLWLVGVMFPLLLYPYAGYRMVRRVMSLADQADVINQDEALQMMYGAFGEFTWPLTAALVLGNLVLLTWYAAIDRNLLVGRFTPYPSRPAHSLALVATFFAALLPIWLANLFGPEMINNLVEANEAQTFAAQFQAQLDFRGILLNISGYFYLGLLVYVALQLAKGLKSLFERHFEHRQDVGIIVLLLLFPIVGFWKLQPKINAIVAGDGTFNPEDRIEP